jgi:hypothetical protein
MTAVAFKQQFQRGDATAEDLQSAVDDILTQLAEPASEIAGAARRAGVPPGALMDPRVEVSESRQGVEPALTTIAVAIAVNSGSAVAQTLWTEVIWPRLRRRLGARALGPTLSAWDESD